MRSSDLSASSDSALVVAMARYQQEALAEAYRRHAGAVFGLAKRLLTSQASAEEVTQEVFMRLWNRPEQYDAERGSLRSYLLAQCHGRSVDLLRSESARRRRETRDARESPESAPFDFERQLWDMSLAEQVRSALSSLGEGERDAIELAYFGGRTYREVATMLGEAEGTVKSRIRTGLKRMRSQLVAAGVSVGAA
jgi:RNA polymerase sigma-70 factor, ECF subfamily